MYFISVFLVVSLVSKCAMSISNSRNISEELTEALLNLSGIAIQGRQNQQYYPQYYPHKYPSYYQQYKPQNYQYGYPPSYATPDYSSNEIPNSGYPYYPTAYPEPPYHRIPPIIQKTQESVMDALFSIAQNDDLQCVPKLLCDVTSGGLTARQGGFNLPANVNLESLIGFLSGVNSASMSPVLHFGKAAILGFASKGNSKSCHQAYPECPGDPGRLIQYLNNHNGGFFRFFQGIKPAYPNHQQQNYAQYFNGYRPGYFGKSALAEERIQNQPSHFINSNYDQNTYYKEHGQNELSFPQVSYTTPISYEALGPQRVAFPNYGQDNNWQYPGITSGAKALKFPSRDSNDDAYRRGKKLNFDTYVNFNNANLLDIQRPLPNHVPTPNIYPVRTGTGELKLDLDDLEHNYQQSLAYDFDHYNQLLYDSFPNNGHRRPSRLSFPNK